MALPICGIVTTVIGAILVVVISVVGFVAVPNILHNMITNKIYIERKEQKIQDYDLLNFPFEPPREPEIEQNPEEVALIEDTIQLERFQVIPVSLDFNVYLFKVINPDDVTRGWVPIVEEVGPYVYKMTRERVVEDMDDNTISYRILERFEFDAEASYPNHEDDMVTIVNAPFHAILQVAAIQAANLMGVLNTALNRVFGDYATPYATYRVRDILFDGVHLCVNPGLIGGIACNLIRETAVGSPNLQVLENNTVVFSLFGQKNGIPGNLYKVDRGTDNVDNLGTIYAWDNSTRLHFWSGDTTAEDEQVASVCNHLNGTDTAIFPPFVDTAKSLYGFNPDICRSVELRFERDESYEDIDVVRYTADEWFLDNDDGCFCVNATEGNIQSNGCLHRGTLELYSCVGAFMVLSYPHFLFADFEYSNNVLGLAANEEQHKIFLDIEPNTGTIIRGAKRAQFNIFARPITGISSTQQLRTTLTPVFWVEEGMSLPEDLVDEVKTKLLRPLRLVDILRIVFITLSAVILVIGAAVIVRQCTRKEDIVGLGTSAKPL